MEAKGGVDASNSSSNFILHSCFILFYKTLGVGRGTTANRFLQQNQMMNNLLKSDPQLSIITGPVDSGKSVLLRKVIMGLKNKRKTPVLYINLRNVSFNSVNSFYHNTSE